MLARETLLGDLPSTAQKGLENTFLSCLVGPSEDSFALKTPNSKSGLSGAQGTIKRKGCFSTTEFLSGERGREPYLLVEWINDYYRDVS